MKYKIGDVVEVELKNLVEDANNPRTGKDEDEEMADSLEQHGLMVPLELQSIDDIKFKIRNGHRRFRGAKILQKRKGKQITLKGIIVEDKDEHAKLIKQAAGDIQQKNWSVEDRDKAWEKIWVKNKFQNNQSDRTEFRKLIGTTSANVGDFLDRRELPKELKNLNWEGKAGLLQETEVLKKERPEIRNKILKHAHEKGIGAMQLRQEVRVLKDSSDKLVGEYIKGNMKLEQVNKLKVLDDEGQDKSIKMTAGLQKHIDNVDKIVKKGVTISVTKVDEKKIRAQDITDAMLEASSDASLAINKIESTLKIIEKEKLEVHFSSTMKKQISVVLQELEDAITPALKEINTITKKWR